jgi:hypothetical protein
MALVALALAVALAPSPSAVAESKGPMISGSVTGSLAAGGTLTIEIDAQEVGGWQGLHRLDVSLLIGGAVADAVSYDIENTVLIIGEARVVAGTGSTAEGPYLSVSGTNVVVTTGGANLDLKAKASVTREIPSDASFRLSATDDEGRTTAITRRVNMGKTSGGLSWGTAAAYIAVALLAGGFLGNLVASRRRAPPRLSVYATIQRRIDEERSGAASAP